MTALDQAFIKAFAQQNASSTEMPPRTQTWKPAATNGRAPDDAEAVSLPASEFFDGVLAALERPPSKGSGFWVRGQDLGFRFGVQGTKIPESLLADPESPIPNPQSLIPVSPQFKPAWQVDRFTWPTVCRRLMTRAAEEFDRLANAMTTANSQGKKVLAFAGCHRGEGATTLLLCARQLAERGIKAALVDADPFCPCLAKCLGVKPQVGWDETSDNEEGHTADQAIIEATANGLALATVREPSSDDGPAVADWERLASCLNVLRDHYEMVLVDLGSLEDAAGAHDGLFQAVGTHLDGILLVHSRRITSEEEINELQGQLESAGIAVAGVIENFVTL